MARLYGFSHPNQALGAFVSVRLVLAALRLPPLWIQANSLKSIDSAPKSFSRRSSIVFTPETPNSTGPQRPGTSSSAREWPTRPSRMVREPTAACCRSPGVSLRTPRHIRHALPLRMHPATSMQVGHRPAPGQLGRCSLDPGRSGTPHMGEEGRDLGPPRRLGLEPRQN